MDNKNGLLIIIIIRVINNNHYNKYIINYGLLMESINDLALVSLISAVLFKSLRQA